MRVEGVEGYCAREKGGEQKEQYNTREEVVYGHRKTQKKIGSPKTKETYSTTKENPDSQKSSLIKLLILKKCSFASSFVSFCS